MHSFLIAVAFLIFLLAPVFAAFSSDIFPLTVRIPRPSKKSRRTPTPQSTPTSSSQPQSALVANSVARSASLPQPPIQQHLFPSRAAWKKVAAPTMMQLHCTATSPPLTRLRSRL